MKLGLFSTYDSGGAGVAALRLHKGLRSIGEDSTLFVKYKSSNQPFTTQLHTKEIDNCLLDSLNREHFITNIQEGNTMCSVMYPSVGVNYLSSLEGCELVNCHWISTFVSLEAIIKIRQNGLPVVWTLHDQNAMTGVCHYTHGCRKYTKDCKQCPQLRDNEKNIPQTVLCVKKRYIPEDIVIVTPSQWLADCARESAVFRKHRIEVIPYSLETDIFQPIEKMKARIKLGIEPSKKIILFGAVSLAERRKGFAELLEAMHRIRSNPLVQQWLRDGQLQILTFGQPSSLLDGLDIPYQSLGYISDSNRLISAYSAADVVALPSLEDNLPNVMLESLSCGTPVVAFQTGGMVDVIRHGENGFLAPLIDTEKFGQYIVLILQGCCSGTLCRDFAEENFRLERQALEYRMLFQDVIKNNKSVPVSIDLDETPIFPEIAIAFTPWMISAAMKLQEEWEESRGRIEAYKELVGELCGKDIKKLIVFGAGETGCQLVRVLGKRCQGIIDNDMKKWGIQVEHLQVSSPEMLESNDRSSIFVLIASSAFKEISKQLNNLGFDRGIHYDVFY